MKLDHTILPSPKQKCLTEEVERKNESQGTIRQKSAKRVQWCPIYI